VVTASHSDYLTRIRKFESKNRAPCGWVSASFLGKSYQAIEDR